MALIIQRHCSRAAAVAGLPGGPITYEQTPRPTPKATKFGKPVAVGKPAVGNIAKA